MADNPINVAVVGCGYWGKNLVRNFAQLAHLRLCCDPSDVVRARIRTQYPDVRVTADYAEVLGDPEIEAVVLATPAALHAEMALAALRAGKHVFVEKPLALSLEDAQRVADCAAVSGRILMVGHLLEYHPAVEYLKDLIERGELGDIYYLYSHRVNLGKLRSDENALWSLAPHDISVILYLLGEEPEEVYATGQAFLQDGVEDVVFVTLKFGSGRLAHVQVSWLDPHKERRLTVVGSRKMAVFDDAESREKIRIYDKGIDRQSADAPSYSSYHELLTMREGEIVIPRISNEEPLAVECRQFLAAIETGIPPRSDERDGVRVVRVLEAAQTDLARRRLQFLEVV